MVVFISVLVKEQTCGPGLWIRLREVLKARVNKAMFYWTFDSIK